MSATTGRLLSIARQSADLRLPPRRVQVPAATVRRWTLDKIVLAADVPGQFLLETVASLSSANNRGTDYTRRNELTSKRDRSSAAAALMDAAVHRVSKDEP